MKKKTSKNIFYFTNIIETKTQTLGRCYAHENDAFDFSLIEVFEHAQQKNKKCLQSYAYFLKFHYWARGGAI